MDIVPQPHPYFNILILFENITHQGVAVQECCEL
uniref:Uncharacterized protein n=1 Tax=Heterorhabditis bacteriophora TaxID=37862 RepID=A0A1I7WJ21_HETBA